MEIEAQLQAMDRVALTDVVRWALGSDTVQLGDWGHDPIGAARLVCRAATFSGSVLDLAGFEGPRHAANGVCFTTG